LLFSATFSPDIMNLARQWTFDPITVEIEPERVATENVEHACYLLESRDRLNVLKRILAEPDATSVIVFANRRDQVRRVYERLNKQGLECGILSGEVAQVKRTKTLERF
jgi:ATP-dependent RNA helicase RhlB